jgi:hypothetical protein
VTINTDDPAIMDHDLGREYRLVGEAFDLDLAIELLEGAVN